MDQTEKKSAKLEEMNRTTIIINDFHDKNKEVNKHFFDSTLNLFIKCSGIMLDRTIWVWRRL